MRPTNRFGFHYHFRIMLAAFAVLILGPLPAGALDIGGIQFVESYGGAHPAEFTALLSQVEAIVPAALAYITAQWGLSNTLRYPLIVTIADIPTKDAARPVAAYVRAVRSNGEVRQNLVVDLQHHLMYPDDNLEQILYHEMAHAILQDAVTSAEAAGIPQWFNEGLAQTVTTEGHDRTLEDFKRWGHTDAQAVLCDLNGYVDVFYHGEYNFGCYTQFYLAVHQLIALSGKDGLPRLMDGLRDGTPLPDLVQPVTGLNWIDFQTNVHQFTRDVFSGKLPVP